LENPVFSKIQRQLARHRRFILHLGSSYALLAANMGAMFLLTPMLIHRLGNEQYGIWLLLFGITNYFNLSSFGFGQTFTLELIKKQHQSAESNQLVNTLFFSLFLFASATFPVFLLIQHHLDIFRISPGMMPVASRSLWLVYAVFFINFLSQMPYNVLFARNRLGLRNGIEIGRVLLNFGLTFLVLSTGGGIEELSLISLLTAIIYGLALLFGASRLLRFQIRLKHFSKEIFRKFLRPSLHFFMLGLAMQVIVFSDSLLVSSLESPAMVAAYTIALRLPDVSMRLIFKIADVKAPKITTLFDAASWQGLWLLHNRLFWLSAGTSAMVALLLLFLGPAVIHLWIGPEFHVNSMLLLIFCLNMFTQAVLHVPGIFIQSMGMHERASILSMIGAVVSVTGAWYFSKSLGLTGIALAMCGTQFLVGILVVPQFYQFLYLRLREQGKFPNIFQLKA
jgi:O-antigen/teichoic acid export membrane protein